ncbi:MAG: GAF domain-containing protein [Anaerolineae bacterium]|nr:GAF domain-containing protein [Anaerolineae bacterium]
MVSSLSPVIRQELDNLATDWSRRVKKAQVPGYVILAQPVLQQSARQLFTALIDSLETDDEQYLVDAASSQAEVRRQQGVDDDDLVHAATIFCRLIDDFVIRQFPSPQERVGHQAKLKPILSAFMGVFKAAPKPKPDALPIVSPLGGKSMSQDRPSQDLSSQDLSSQDRPSQDRPGSGDQDDHLDQERILRQLEISAQVSRQLTAALDLDELLLQVVELIKTSFNYYHVHVYLLDPESALLFMREGTGEAGAAMKARGHRIELGRGFVGRVGETGEPSLVGDVSQNAQWLPNPLLPDTRSELTVPLKIGGDILGVLDVQSNQVNGLTESDLSLMESLGQQIAVAVQNAILFRETRAVSVISRAVSSGLGMEQVFAAVSRELRALLDFDYMTIATYFEITDQVELMGVDDRTGVDMPLEEGVQLPVDLCIPGMAIRQNRSIVVPDLTSEQFSTFIDAEILSKHDMRSILSVPLVTQGQIGGTINLVSSRIRAFTAADAHLMEQISGQLAASLANARVYENVQQLIAERTSEIAVFRAVIENAAEAIVLTNLEQVLTYANPAFYRMYGYDPDTDPLPRRPLTFFIVTDDEGALSDELRDKILQGDSWQAEGSHQRQDGTHFVASITVFGIRGQEGTLTSFAAVIRDVTAERKIMAISRAASMTPELDQLAPLVLQEIAADTNIDRIVLFLYDEITKDGPQTMFVVAVHDPATDGRRIVDQHLTVDQSPFSVLVYYEKSPIFVADVETDERLSERGREMLLENQLLSMLALPIWVRDEVVGMVGIDWRKHVELTRDQIVMYQTMVNQVSAAVENAHLMLRQQRELQQSLDRRGRELATSIEVGQAIAMAPALDDLFARVVTLIKERFDYYHAHVYQVDPEKGDLEMMAGYGEPGRIMKERGHRIPMGKGLVGTAAATGAPVRVGDVSKQDNWLSNPLLPDTKSEVAVPIKLGNEVLGVLDVQSERLDGVNQDDELLLLGLCGQIATSINNAQLLGQLHESRLAAQRRAQQLELSAGVSEELSSTLALDELLTQVVFLIREGFNYTHAHIYLVDQETGDLVMAEGTGEAGMVLKERGYRLEPGQGLVGQAADTGLAVLVPNVSKHEGWVPNPLLLETRSEIAVPLKIGRQVLGVLDVQDDRVNGLGEDDLSVLEGLGGQIAIAVQNALNFRNIETQVQERTRQVRRFESLAENAADSIAMADLQGNITFANEACFKLYGYDQAKNELIGVPMSQLWADDSLALMEQAVQQGLEGEWRGRVPQICKNGKRIITALTLFAVRDDLGNPIAVAVLGRDITADELVEQVHQLISTVDSLSELSVELLRLIIHGVEVEQGRFVLYQDDDGAGPRTARVLAFFDETAPDVVAVDVRDAFDRDTIHRYLYDRGEPVICNTLTDRDAQMEKVCQELSRETFAAFPITIQNRVGGMLLLERGAKEPFSDAEIAFFSSIIQQISLAISNFILRDVQRIETQSELERRRQEALTTTEVAQAIAAATELDELFKRVVTLVKERFNYYHVHLYELIPERDELVLVAGYGEPGRKMVEAGWRLAVGRKGLNSTAVVTRQPVLVADTRQDPNWLPNELLPETRAELAVPIMMGDEVLGVLDVQQDRVNGLTEVDQTLLLTLCGQIASAMQNTRLLQSTQASLHRTDLLLSLSTALSSLTNPQDIADVLAEQMMSIANIERCVVSIVCQYDAQDIPILARVYAIQDRDPTFEGGIPAHVEYALADYAAIYEQAILNKQTFIVNDVAVEARLSEREREMLAQEKAVSFVAVPMIAGERIRGYILLQDRQPYVFSDQDLDLYQGIANQSAVALSNALLLTQVRETLEDQRRLYESSRAIAMATTLEALTDIIVQQIVPTNVDRCEIMFFEQRGRRKIISVAGGWMRDADFEPGTRYRQDDYPLIELVQELNDKGSQVISDAEVDALSKAAQQVFVKRAIKALALVPLVAGEEYIGFITVERHLSSEFNADALRLYETIASQSAVGLRNVQLIAQSQQQLNDLQKSYDDVARLANTVRQLSSPVIQIWQDVLVLPLVGTIDSQRAMRIMEDLLTGITRFQAEQVIIDVTGVPVMDGAIVNHLMQTIRAATLLGAKCMLVGIDSEKAQTIVTLGLDWKGIRTFSNLRAGIQAALQELGFAIMPFSPIDEEQV